MQYNTIQYKAITAIKEEIAFSGQDYIDPSYRNKINEA